MSAPAFTEGPWLIHAIHRWIVPAEDAFKEPAEALPICQLRDPDERLTEDETLANGFLITAAPDGYDAAEFAAEIIRMLVAQLATFGVQPACNAPLAIEKLESFTAKARGGQ